MLTAVYDLRYLFDNSLLGFVPSLPASILLSPDWSVAISFTTHRVFSTDIQCNLSFAVILTAKMPPLAFQASTRLCSPTNWYVAISLTTHHISSSPTDQLSVRVLLQQRQSESDSESTAFRRIFGVVDNNKRRFDFAIDNINRHIATDDVD